MEFLTDFHIHSTFSDGQISIPKIVDFYGCRGFGAISITDHLCENRTWMGTAAKKLERTLTPESFPAYLVQLRDEKERAWDQYNMVLIPGVEITKNSLANSRSAHILGLGIQDWVSADDDALDILKGLRAQNAITVAAHPVWTRRWELQTFHLWSRREELAPYFDAWEVASGAKRFHEVERARLPLLANSDLHHPRQMTSWKTVMSCELHPEAILRAIKRQELNFRFYQDPFQSQTKLLFGFNDIFNDAKGSSPCAKAAC